MALRKKPASVDLRKTALLPVLSVVPLLAMAIWEIGFPAASQAFRPSEPVTEVSVAEAVSGARMAELPVTPGWKLDSDEGPFTTGSLGPTRTAAGDWSDQPMPTAAPIASLDLLMTLEDLRPTID